MTLLCVFVFLFYDVESVGEDVVPVCVCERERERERFVVCVCVCVVGLFCGGSYIDE